MVVSSTPIGQVQQGVHWLSQWTAIDPVRHWWCCNGSSMVLPRKNRYSGPLAVSLLASRVFGQRKWLASKHEACWRYIQCYSCWTDTVRSFNPSIYYNYWQQTGNGKSAVELPVEVPPPQSVNAPNFAQLVKTLYISNRMSLRCAHEICKVI